MAIAAPYVLAGDAPPMISGGCEEGSSRFRQIHTGRLDTRVFVT
jgi:hypothetical protein